MINKRKLDFLNRVRGSWVSDRGFEKIQKKRIVLELKEAKRMRECVF